MTFPTIIPRNRAAFTIIEVMIVLVVAAVILLIVFLAVPALQRNSRNTQRRADVSRIKASWEEYITQNNNVIPSGTTAINTAKTAIFNNAQPQILEEVHITDAVTTTSASSATVIRAIFRTQSKCNSAGDNVDGATSVGRVAFIYFTEVSGGGWKMTCDQLI